MHLPQTRISTINTANPNTPPTEPPMMAGN